MQIWHHDLTKPTITVSIPVPSVLWRCWLGGRKGIRPVKNMSGGVMAWLSVWTEMQTCIWPSWCHCHSLSLAPVKSRLVLPFWYQLTRVVPEKGPLNECVCIYIPGTCHEDISVDSDQRMWHVYRRCTVCPLVHNNQRDIPDDNTATDWLQQRADGSMLDQA